MIKLKDKYINLIILCIIMVGAWTRVVSYGSLLLSIGMLDTQSYIDSSMATNSLKTAFTERRLFTTNLLYKLIENEQTCKLTSSSNPYMGEEGVRKIQPCFNRIVLLQNILSIFGWCLLAWTTAKHLKSIPYKIVITILILTFGFTPQIAEWDSILSSESLSLSSFAIGLAILLEIVFWMAEKRENNSNFNINILLILWLCVFTLWLFIRDVHIYAVIVTLVLTIPILFIRKYRRIKILTAIIAILIIFVIAGNYASKLSPRWQPSLTHVLDYYIFPYPSRV